MNGSKNEGKHFHCILLASFRKCNARRVKARIAKTAKRSGSYTSNLKEIFLTFVKNIIYYL